MEEEFDKFLKENGVYDDYYNDLEKVGHGSFPSLENGDFNKHLDAAYKWGNKTDKGLNFWVEIGQKWNEYLKSKKKEE